MPEIFYFLAALFALCLVGLFADGVPLRRVKVPRTIAPETLRKIRGERF